MAAPKRQTRSATAPPDFGDRMKQAREGADMSLMDAAFAIRGLLPDSLRVSVDPIRRMEIGSTAEEKASPVLVLALARAYGVEVAELSEVVAEQLAMVERLVNSDPSDLGFPMKRCTRPSQPTLFDVTEHAAAA